MNQESSQDFAALNTILTALQPLQDDDRMRILKAAALFLGIDIANVATKGAIQDQASPIAASTRMFSDKESLTPKEFLLDKQPRTDVERIACLAYYLTHYREIPYFRTLELSKLNTEAAQPKFANTAYSANNALKSGYLVQAARGQRQLSAAGEQFVRSLPDREAARAAMSSVRSRQTKSRRRINSDKEGQ